MFVPPVPSPSSFVPILITLQSNSNHALLMFTGRSEPADELENARLLFLWSDGRDPRARVPCRLWLVPLHDRFPCINVLGVQV